ncbi:MAG: response regulator transcription factor [Rhodocyclaceae bacterium]|nr:MAG: response regulator transcription factor [Rhodocyclaceae bacterium]
MALNHLHGVQALLADDHALVRRGFALLLEGAGALPPLEAANGEEALRLYGLHTPPLLVMDVSMPGMGGLVALERLMAWHPQAKVLMLSAHTDTVTPLRALRLGATGYVSKQCEPDTFLAAASQVVAGKRTIDPALAPALALAQMGDGGHPAETLTDREYAVFLHLAQGRSVQQVAEELHLSGSTVGTHLYHIKQKLKVSNGAEMALMAVRNGLIEA